MRFDIQDHTGHSTIEFTKEQKAEAEKKFYELLEKGHTPAHRDEQGGDYHVTRKFNPEAEETLFVPHLRGG